MKKLFYFFITGCMCFLFSCKDENYTTVVMEGSYNSKKAIQVSSTSTIYENIARQPELANELVNRTCVLAGYKDFMYLLPFEIREEERQVGMARGECLSAFMTSVARQPDMYEKLDSAAVVFLGTAETLSSMSVLLDYSCYNAIAGYNEALTRQPEIKDTLDIICRKFLGVVFKE
mgnify:FL=1